MTGFFVDLLLRGAALSLLAALALALLRRAPASQRHLVCVVALAALPTLPLAGRVLPPLTVRTERHLPPTPVVPPYVGSSSAAEEGLMERGTSGIEGRWSAPAAAPLLPTAPPPPPMPQPAPAAPPVEPLPIVWAAGALLLLGRLAFALLRLRRLHAASRPAAIDGVDVRVSANVSTPLTWGVRRPVVLLPEALLATCPDACASAVRHEMAHVARRDWLWHLLAEIVCALCWFQPGAWWLRRRLRAESERACDDRVLLSGVAGPDYAAHLVEILRHGKGGALAPGLTPGERMEARVRHILDPKRPRRTYASRLAVTALLAALALPLAALKVAALPAEPSDLPAPRLSDAPAAELSPGVAPLAIPSLTAPAPTAPLAPPTPETYPLQKVVWSDPVDGVQAGIQLLAAENVARGDAPIVYRLLLRNATDTSIELCVESRRDAPYLTPTGKPIGEQFQAQVAPDAPSQTPPAFALTLAPQESVVLPDTRMLFVGRGDQPRFPRIEPVAAGRHLLAQPLVVRTLTPTDRTQRTRFLGRLSVTCVRSDGSVRQESVVRLGAQPGGRTLYARTSVEVQAPPATPTPTVPLRDVVWNDAVDGLQAGLWLLSPANGRIPDHSVAAYKVLLRNVSDKPLKFMTRLLAYDGYDLPSLGDAAAQGAPRRYPLDPLYYVTLAPGESVIVPGQNGNETLELFIGAGQSGGRPQVTLARPGPTRLVQRLTVYRDPDKAALAHLMGIYTITRVAPDGRIHGESAERASGQGGGTGRIDGGKTMEAKAAITVVGDGIAWGAAEKDGLQAGIRLYNPPRAYPVNDLLKAEVLYRNARSTPLRAALPEAADLIPIVRSATRAAQPLTSGSNLHPQRPVATLAPGEVRSLGVLSTPINALSPGRYEIRAMGGYHEPGAGSPTSGEVSITVVAASPGANEPIWGDANRGLQCGIRLVGGKTAFRYGETLRAEVLFRNVSPSAMTIAMPRAFDLYPSVSDESGRGVRLDLGARPMLRPHSDTLEPGAVRSLGVVEITVLPEGAAPSRTVEMRLSVPPGRYFIHAQGGVRYPDGPAPVSGGVPFSVVADTKAPQPEGVAWGKAEGGLQWGVRLLGPAQPLRWHEAVQAEVFVRNVSNAPADALLPDRLDLIPVVHAADGRRMTVERGGRFDLGPAGRQRLEPGAAWRVGRISLTALRPGERAVGFAGALLPPGDYRLGVTSGGVRVESGNIPFTVEPGGEIAWGVESNGWRYGLRDAGDGRNLEVWVENRTSRAQPLLYPIWPPSAQGYLEGYDPQSRSATKIPQPEIFQKTQMRQITVESGRQAQLYKVAMPPAGVSTVRWRTTDGESTGSIGVELATAAPAR